MIHINSIRPTLCIDLESGYGDVGNTQHFMKLSPITRLDILHDWIDDLEFLREEAQNDLKKNMRNARRRQRYAMKKTETQL